MRAGAVVSAYGHYWRVYSVFYVPSVGIRINMERPRASCHTLLSSLWANGGRVVRQGGVLRVKP